jgi:hypothetical protein
VLEIAGGNYLFSKRHPDRVQKFAIKLPNITGCFGAEFRQEKSLIFNNYDLVVSLDWDYFSRVGGWWLFVVEPIPVQLRIG